MMDSTIFDLAIRLFRFHAKTDYLPCYTNFGFEEIDGSLRLSELTQLLLKKDSTIGIKINAVELKINGIAILKDLTLKELVAAFGTEWTVEPLSARFAVHDLLMDERAFLERLKLIDFRLEPEDNASYASYRTYFFVSDVLRLNPDYYGESLFAFVADYLEIHPEQEEKLLTLISDHENGIWSFAGISHQCYPFDDGIDAKILKLRKKVCAHTHIDEGYGKAYATKVGKAYETDSLYLNLLKGEGQ